MLDTSCDTLVVLGPHTRDGHTLFAKNSDRPPDECQPLFRAPRLAHPDDALLCQYLEARVAAMLERGRALRAAIETG